MIGISVIQHLTPNAMNELMKNYHLLKRRALELMKAGKVNAYLATLVEVNDVRAQLIQLTVNR